MPTNKRTRQRPGWERLRGGCGGVWRRGRAAEELLRGVVFKGDEEVAQVAEQAEEATSDLGTHQVVVELPESVWQQLLTEARRQDQQPAEQIFWLLRQHFQALVDDATHGGGPAAE